MLRWGILGTARINLKIVPFLQGKLQNQKLVAVASRTSEKAKAYASELGIEKYFGSYEELIRSSDVDAIYISLPNDQHFKWAKECLENKKHVLCEKPLVLTSSHVKELTKFSLSKSKILMEGFMYRHHQQIQNLHEVVSSGRLGRIQHVRSSFHFTIPPGPNIRLDAKSGGGALWDLGCYIVDVSNFIFSKPPLSASATALFENGVDVGFAGLMNYGLGESASFDCSFRGIRRNTLEIVGTEGILSLPQPFKGLKETTLTLTRDGTAEEISVVDDVDPYEREFMNFYNAIQGVAKPAVSLSESFDTARVIEALLEAAKEATIVKL